MNLFETKEHGREGYKREGDGTKETGWKVTLNEGDGMEGDGSNGNEGIRSEVNRRARLPEDM